MHVAMRTPARRTHARNLPLHAHPARLLSGPDAFRGFEMRTLRAHHRSGLFPSLADPQTVPVGPLAGLCQFWNPVLGWAGRGSRGQPASALGGAHALRPPSLRTARRGTRVRVLQRHYTEGTLGYSRGPLGAYRYRGGTHGTPRGNASQGLELLVTVLLARNRQPQPAVAAGGPHADFAAELVSLPSGLLAMVCEAIGKLKVRLGAAGKRACVCA